MAIGKLSVYDGEFLANVDYRLYNESVHNWWGEFTLTEYRRLEDGDGYMIELEDGRKGKCFLKKKVNRAVYGLLPLFCYHFKGNGLLE
jgi:hypothetical protein